MHHIEPHRENRHSTTASIYSNSYRRTDGAEGEDNEMQKRNSRHHQDTNLNETSARPTRPQNPVIVDLSACKYQVVRDCAAEVGWVESSRAGQSDDFTVFWTDLSVSNDRVLKLKNFQYINHFPGMSGICRKIPLARNLNRMKRVFPSEYCFFPQSWVLPFDASAFKRYKFQDGRTFIIKPNSGSQGRGIILTRDQKEADNYGDCVVQVYVDRPFLIEKRKFDLRVYCLVTSVDPELRAFLFRDGLVRLCTEPYHRPTDRNISNACMHLTNYSLNKRNDHYVANDETDNFSTGSKRNFQFLDNFLARIGRDPTHLWSDIADVVLKTIISITPQLKRQYRMCLGKEKFNPYSCFEILGVDIMLDYKLQPWLIEVNHSPSFNTDTPLDKQIKHNLVKETMKLISIDPRERGKYLRQEKIRRRERIHGEASTGTHSPDNERYRSLDMDELTERQAQTESENLKDYLMIYPTQTFDLNTSLEQQMENLGEDENVIVRTTEPYSVVERYRLFVEQSERIASFGTDNHVSRLYPGNPLALDRGKEQGNGSLPGKTDPNGKGTNSLSSKEDNARGTNQPRVVKNSKYAHVQSRFMEYEKRPSVPEMDGGEDEEYCAATERKYDSRRNRPTQQTTHPYVTLKDRCISARRVPVHMTHVEPELNLGQEKSNEMTVSGHARDRATGTRAKAATTDDVLSLVKESDELIGQFSNLVKRTHSTLSNNGEGHLHKR